MSEATSVPCHMSPPQHGFKSGLKIGHHFCYFSSFLVQEARREYRKSGRTVGNSCRDPLTHNFSPCFFFCFLNPERGKEYHMHMDRGKHLSWFHGQLWPETPIQTSTPPSKASRQPKAYCVESLLLLWTGNPFTTLANT